MQLHKTEKCVCRGWRTESCVFFVCCFAILESVNTHRFPDSRAIGTDPPDGSSAGFGIVLQQHQYILKKAPSYGCGYLHGAPGTAAKTYAGGVPVEIGGNVGFLMSALISWNV